MLETLHITVLARQRHTKVLYPASLEMITSVNQASYRPSGGEGSILRIHFGMVLGVQQPARAVG